MKIMKKTYWLLLPLLYLCSCDKSDTGYRPEGGDVREMTIEFELPAPEVVDTRAKIRDTGLQSITACTSDAQGNVLQKGIEVTGLTETQPGRYTGRLSVGTPSKISQIHFFANSNPTIPSRVADFGNIVIDFEPATEPLTRGLPMWASAEFKGESHRPEARLLRAVAACSICSETPRLQIKEVTLCQADMKVHICPGTQADTPHPVEGLPFDRELTAGPRSVFYFPECSTRTSDQKRACLLIKASYGEEMCYYRIDFYKNGAYFTPLRNRKYQFRIIEASQKGWATSQEALENTGANVQSVVKIDITENTNEIVTDGTYRFDFSAVNVAVSDPRNFHILSFETDCNQPCEISQQDASKNWLGNLRLVQKGSISKRLEVSPGRFDEVVFYQWELYGDFSQSLALKKESPIWGRRSQQIRLTCGKFEKQIGVTQSLMNTHFVNYPQFVQTHDRHEYQIGTIEYDLLDPNEVETIFSKGLDLRTEAHKLRVWVDVGACSPNQQTHTDQTELKVNISVSVSDAKGNLTPQPVKELLIGVNPQKDSRIYFDVVMPEVTSDNATCINRIEVALSMPEAVDNHLVILQRYSKEGEN